VELAGGLGSSPRVCRNACRFCFVDQLPPGLRAGLYVKDDDYRLSFLEGNFVTLSNMGDDDLERVERLRLSPLYVSLHAWDDARRVALMGSAARTTRARLERLAAAGIRSHVQIVLCPGWNDGVILEETILRLAGLQSVEDVGVVPVSLAAEGELRRVTPADAEAAVALIEALQHRLRRELGRAFVHAADELYLLCAAMPPPADAELQYENGIGICAAFLEEAARCARHRVARQPPLALLSGTLAEPVVRRACELLGDARPFVVDNGLFGPHVTVTGLLGGRDVIAALRHTPLQNGERLTVPRAFLPRHAEVSLDGVTLDELRCACAGRLVVAESLGDALETSAASR
jgi:putative radical SAM enzyme (TIGR03279 family)